MAPADRIWEKFKENNHLGQWPLSDLRILFRNEFKKAFPIIEDELVPKPCVWEREGSGYFATQCGSGYKKDKNGLKFYTNFCPYCGGKIIEPPKQGEVG